MASIFTKIVNGELPSHKIYEDDTTLAFLSIYPVQPAHVLVIPKEEIEFVWDMPDSLYQDVMATSKKVALHLREIMGTKYVHERIVGTDVPHAHVHLIPFDSSDQLSVTPDETAEPDHTALAEIAKKLRIN